MNMSKISNIILQSILLFLSYESDLGTMIRITECCRQYLELRKNIEVNISINKTNIKNVIKILLYTNSSYYKFHLFNVDYVTYSLICEKKVNNIIGIIFHYDFDNEMVYIPESLKYIVTGYHYSQPIDHLFNSNIEYLALGCHFTKPIIKYPTNLKHLVLNLANIKNSVIPEKLVSLSIFDLNCHKNNKCEIVKFKNILPSIKKINLQKKCACPELLPVTKQLNDIKYIKNLNNIEMMPFYLSELYEYGYIKYKYAFEL